jgi:hypothetical protein
MGHLKKNFIFKAGIKFKYFYAIPYLLTGKFKTYTVINPGLIPI